MSHIIILGAGAIGLSSALACQRRGHHVTIIDRLPALRDGCSFGNAGMIVPSHFVPLAAPGMVALGFKWMWDPESPFYIKPRLDMDLVSWGMKFMRAATPDHVRRSAPLIRDLSLASRKQFIAWQENGDDLGLVTKGLIMLSNTTHGWEEERITARKARDLGIPAEVLDARQVAALEPGVTMDIAGGVYFPQDCHLWPERLLAMMEEKFLAAGGAFVWDTRVTGWKKQGNTLAAALTSTGEINGDQFILALGTWSGDLSRDLGLRLPMQAGKGYSVTVATPIELPEKCAILTEARVAITPMGKALRFGGTMEIAGRTESVNPRRVRGIIKAACKYFPRFKESDFDGIAPWHGLRPCSPDGLPYLGRTRAADNLVVATGHAMMGISLAPITGDLVGNLIDGEPPAIDINMLDPDRHA